MQHTCQIDNLNGKSDRSELSSDSNVAIICFFGIQSILISSTHAINKANFMSHGKNVLFVEALLTDLTMTI